MHHDRPRQPELVAEPVHGRRDHAEVLGDERQPVERVLDGAEELHAGPAPPSPVARGLVPRRDRPVRDVAAEVVDAREVDELEHAAEALDPPVIARRVVHRPGVERIAPVLAVRVQRVRRRAGHLAVGEQLRPRLDVRALVGDVDRHVADQPHAAVARVRAQRAPLPLEPHLVGDRAGAGEARPLADPVRMTRDELVDLRPASPVRPASRAVRETRRTPTASGTASGTRPAARAAASATTTALPPRASRRTGTPRRRACRRGARSDGAGSRTRAAASRRPAYGTPPPGSPITSGAWLFRRRASLRRGSRSSGSSRRSTAGGIRSSGRSATGSR